MFSSKHPGEGRKALDPSGRGAEFKLPSNLKRGNFQN